MRLAQDYVWHEPVRNTIVKVPQRGEGVTCALWGFRFFFHLFFVGMGVLTALFVDYYYYTCFSDPVLLLTFAFVRTRVTDISSSVLVCNRYIHLVNKECVLYWHGVVWCFMTVN